MTNPLKGPESECSCDKCAAMCDHRPCWGTPDEMRKIIEAGFGERLMRDYWSKPDAEIDILAPAIVGYEGQSAPWWPMGRCTFLTDDGLCSLHDLGLKPIEGRLAHHDGGSKAVHRAVAMRWDTRKGRRLVDEWEQRNLGPDRERAK